MQQFVKKKEFSIFLIIVVISTFLAFSSNVFLRLDNILDVMKSNVVLGIISLGMLLVIISGGIDVSVSATIAVITVIAGKFMVTIGGNIITVLIVACVTGALIGLINGLIIAKLEIPPIVTTLGMMSIINGLMLLATNGTWISNLPQWFIDFGNTTIGSFSDGQGGKVGIPIQIFFFIFATILTWFILKYTLIGRGVYAFGGNPISAIRVGYKVQKIQVFIYMYIGLLTGLAAVVHTSIMQQVDPNAFLGTEMMVIAAVVIGGANIMGGAGTVFGTVLGIILLAILNNGLVLAKIPTFWQQIVIGLIIVMAVSVDMIQRKREEKKLVRVDVQEVIYETTNA